MFVSSHKSTHHWKDATEVIDFKVIYNHNILRDNIIPIQHRRKYIKLLIYILPTLWWRYDLRFSRVLILVSPDVKFLPRLNSFEKQYLDLKKASTGSASTPPSYLHTGR